MTEFSFTFSVLDSFSIAKPCEKFYLVSWKVILTPTLNEAY